MSSSWHCASCGYALLDEPNWVTHQEWHRREKVRAEYASADAEIEGKNPADVLPELEAWFHESDEICEHDDRPWPCEVMADHLLRCFTVEPRLTEHAGGTVSFERGCVLDARQTATMTACRQRKDCERGGGVATSCGWLATLGTKPSQTTGSDAPSSSSAARAFSSSSSGIA